MSKKLKTQWVEKPLERQFFLAVANRPDWYRVVSIEDYSDFRPAHAVLQSKSTTTLRLLAKDDRDLYLGYMAYASPGIRREMADKAARQLAWSSQRFNTALKEVCIEELLHRQDTIAEQIIDELLDKQGDKETKNL